METSLHMEDNVPVSRAENKSVIILVPAGPLPILPLILQFRDLYHFAEQLGVIWSVYSQNPPSKEPLATPATAIFPSSKTLSRKNQISSLFCVTYRDFSAASPLQTSL